MHNFRQKITHVIRICALLKVKHTIALFFYQNVKSFNKIALIFIILLKYTNVIRIICDYSWMYVMIDKYFGKFAWYLRVCAEYLQRNNQRKVFFRVAMCKTHIVNNKENEYLEIKRWSKVKRRSIVNVCKKRRNICSYLYLVVQVVHTVAYPNPVG